MKKCNKCNTEKSFDSFNKASREKDGLQSSCRSCNKAYAAEYRKNNPEKERLRHAKYHAENKDVINARVAEWQKNNSDKVRAKAKRFYENNIESEKERHKKWQQSNSGWMKDYAKQYRKDNIQRFKNYDDQYWRNNKSNVYAKNAKRRAKKKMAFVEWADHNKIKLIYAECIRISEETGIEHHVDHIIPLINDKVCGLHNEFNLQILTASENSSKGNKFTPG